MIEKTMGTEKLLVYLKIHEFDFIMAAVIGVVGLLLSQYMKKILLKMMTKNSGDHTVKFFLSYCRVLVLFHIWL